VSRLIDFIQEEIQGADGAAGESAEDATAEVS
jgi:hypothetical protein